MVKKIFLILCPVLIGTIFQLNFALATPEEGIWNATTTGLGDDFNGQFAILDPESDGSNIGDEVRASDTYTGSYPGYGHYWFVDGFIRETLTMTPVQDNGDETGSRPFHTTRKGGTFHILGDNLWGHDAGSTYTVSLEGEAEGTSLYVWDPNLNGGAGDWAWDHLEGNLHWWGYFNEDPFLLSFTADIFLDHWGWSDVFGMNVHLGSLLNAEMKVDPVPEPATMFLVGSGMIGLAGFRKRLRRSK